MGKACGEGFGESTITEERKTMNSDRGEAGDRILKHIWVDSVRLLSKRERREWESIGGDEAEICGGCCVEYVPWEGRSGETRGKVKERRASTRVGRPAREKQKQRLRVGGGSPPSHDKERDESCGPVRWGI